MNNDIESILKVVADLDVEITDSDTLLEPLKEKLDSIDRVYEILLIFGSKLILYQEKSSCNKIYKAKISNLLKVLKFIFSYFIKSDCGKKFFNSTNGDEWEFRWMDLFHAPYNYSDYNLAEFTVHFRNDLIYEERKDLISKAWNWFQGSTTGIQFSLTPLIFVESALPKLLLITNDPDQKADLAYDVILFEKDLLSTINLSLEQVEESSHQIGNDLEKTLDKKKAELKQDTKFQELYEKLNKVLRISNINMDGFAKYVVLTTVFESDIINENKNFYYYYFPAMPGKRTVLSGSVLAIAGKKELSPEIISRFDSTINIWSRYAHQAETERKIKLETDMMNIRIAIIAILVDSFAHNISAHSLRAVTWLYKKRQELMEQKFVNEGLSKNNFEISKNDIQDIIKKIYDDFEKLGKEYNKKYFSLFDLLKNIEMEWGNDLLAYNELPIGHKKTNIKQKPTFPVPLDNEIMLYLKYLQGKASFWSGVLKDATFGGEIKTIYDILFEFSWNPIFLGTIADSEGINEIEINIDFKKRTDKNKHEELENFINIDITALMEDKKDKKNPFEYICLGDKYSNLRKILSDYQVFLPGGIVGRHALYTVFENTIRNVKHTKKNNEHMDKIIFNISIEELDDKVFKFTIWLGNETELDKEDAKKLNECKTQSIIETSGRPKLGGNSQDKICAAMLFTGRFTNVENRDYIYKNDNVEVKQPWIDIPGIKVGDKSVKRGLHLWRGDIYIKLDSDSDLENENVSRFNFAILPQSSTLSGMKIYENGLIRLLNLEFLSEKCTDKNYKRLLGVVVETPKTLPPNQDGCEIKRFLYKFWNQTWIKDINENEKIIQRFLLSIGSSSTPIFVIEKKDGNWAIEEYHGENETNAEYDKIIRFSHGSVLNGRESSENILEVRNHGVSSEKLKIQIIEGTIKPDAERNGYTHEFVESLLTKILIIDNRINKRVFERGKKELYKDNLFLDIHDELELNAGDLKSTLTKGKYNFIILHLSYIESLNGYNERNFESFIKNLFSDCPLDEQTKLVITTGRGRELWTENIEEKYLKHIMMKPIDMLLDAIEDGLMLKDDFSVKYNLVKVLFGS
ncbi:MAG: hypothetical protein NT166_03750 [Candidatus Aminicenantes bacterium]|nr:hypothetical protein [Candidatus Aminicenantes bacterium]